MKRAALVHLLGCSVASAVMLSVWIWRAPVLVFSTSVILAALLGMLALHLFSHPTSRISALTFFLTTVLMVTMVGVNNEVYVRNNLPHEPFIGIKGIAIFIAIICPPIAWTAWVLLLKIRDLLVEWRVKSRLQKKMTHLLVSCQHVMNSPFQSIELLMAMMNQRSPSNQNLYDQSKVHFDKIRKVNEVLSLVNARFDWDSLPLSKDPRELEDQIQNLIEELKKSSCIAAH